MEWKISVMRIRRRIGNARVLESLPPQEAGVAVPARAAGGVGVVAGVGEGVVDAELRALADDVGLGHVDERRDDARLAALDAAALPGLDDGLKRAEKVRSAVGIAAVVDGVDAEPDLACFA